jgi:protein gp37
VSFATLIQWAMATLNPWIGCTKVSRGCAKCYAVTATPTRTLGVPWGKGKPRYRVKTFAQAAYAMDRKAARSGKKITVFPSLCDWLDAEVPIDWLADFLDVVRTTPHLTWILLTKRPENFQVRLIEASLYAAGYRDPIKGEKPTAPEHPAADFIWQWHKEGKAPPNVQILTSCEDQDAWDTRVPAVLEIPAVLRGVSLEPLLEGIDMKKPLATGPQAQPLGRGIQWVIVGGESHKPADEASPCEVMWIDEIIRQCREFECPVFVKQLGSNCISANVNAHDWPDETIFADDLDPGYGACAASIRLKHPKGGDIVEWPPELQVRQLPKEAA